MSFFGKFGYGSDGNGECAVAYEAVQGDSEIYADYITILKNAFSRYAVYNLVVNGDTERTRESVIAEKKPG